MWANHTVEELAQRAMLAAPTRAKHTQQETGVGWKVSVQWGQALTADATTRTYEVTKWSVSSRM